MEPTLRWKLYHNFCCKLGPEGVQIMVHKGHAFVGHMFRNGSSVIDVRDPREPKPTAFVAMPPKAVRARAVHVPHTNSWKFCCAMTSGTKRKRAMLRKRFGKQRPSSDGGLQNETR
jgi:hypothetical protein